MLLRPCMLAEHRPTHQAEMGAGPSRAARGPARLGRRPDAPKLLSNLATTYTLVNVIIGSLHWPPVRQRIEFKLAVLVYKALNGLSPQYLADDCFLLAITTAKLPAEWPTTTSIVQRYYV